MATRSDQWRVRLNPLLSLLLILPLAAQGPSDPLTLDDVLLLQRLGLDPTRILEALDRRGVVPLGPAEIGRAEHAGLPAPLVDRLARVDDRLAEFRRLAQDYRAAEMIGSDVTCLVPREWETRTREFADSNARLLVAGPAAGGAPMSDWSAPFVFLFVQEEGPWIPSANALGDRVARTFSERLETSRPQKTRDSAPLGDAAVPEWRLALRRTTGREVGEIRMRVRSDAGRRLIVLGAYRPLPGPDSDGLWLERLAPHVGRRTVGIGASVLVDPSR